MKNALKGTENEQFNKPSGIKTVTVDAITGRKPNPSTKETRTDIFPSWFSVNDQSGNREIKINKLDGKLATASCPATIVETKYVNPVNAEIPSNDAAFPRWQAPVAAWASQNGYLTGNGDVPTETTTICDSLTKPTSVISSPQEGDNISGKFKVVVKASSTIGIDSVIVYFNDYPFTASLVGANYEVSITPAVKGLYKLKAGVKDKYGQIAESKVVNINVVSLSAAQQPQEKEKD